MSPHLEPIAVRIATGGGADQADYQFAAALQQAFRDGVLPALLVLCDDAERLGRLADLPDVMARAAFCRGAALQLAVQPIKGAT